MKVADVWQMRHEQINLPLAPDHGLADGAASHPRLDEDELARHIELKIDASRSSWRHRDGLDVTLPRGA